MDKNRLVCPGLDVATRELLISKLHEIDRYDLWGSRDSRAYWGIESDEEKSVEGCIEYLLKLFPEKKIYERIYPVNDPYDF